MLMAVFPRPATTAQQTAGSARDEEILQQAKQAESAGNWAEAIAAYQQALQLKPDSAFLESKLASAYFHHQEYEEALDHSRRALASDPRNFEAAKVSGMAAYGLNKPELALKYFQQANSVRTNDGELHYWIGMALYSLRDARHALDEFYRARLYQPKDVETLYMIGKIHWEMCRQAWQEMVRADPDSVRVKQMVAEQDELKDLDPEAIAKYQEIIKQAPNASGYHYELGKLYLRTADIDDAEKAFQGELALDPHSAFAYFGLAQVAFERRNLPTARDDVNRAIQEKPDFGDAYVLLGQVEMNMGDKQKAMEVLEHGAALSPSDASVYFLLGRVYEDLGKHDLAEKAVATYQQLKGEQEREIQVAH